MTSLSKGTTIHVFVTGASGFIASAVVPELVAAGHHVTGLARSDAAAARVEALGAEVRRGELVDTELLAETARAADAVVHLGYHHDFSQLQEAAVLDRAATAAMGAELAGKPLLFASGLVGVRTEDDRAPAGAHPRSDSAASAFALADQDVRVVALRFAPTVHGEGDHGFVAELARVARARGVSAYVGDGSHAWPAAHRLDAGRLVRLALEDATAGTAVHAVAEPGMPTRQIAEALGEALDLPVDSVSAEEAAEHFDWIGAFFGRDLTASSELTRERLGWEPTGPTLLEDIEAGHYTT